MHLGFGRIVVSEIEVPNIMISESGMKRMNGGTKQQCDRALRVPPCRQRALHGLACQPRTVARLDECGAVITPHHALNYNYSGETPVDGT